MGRLRAVVKDERSGKGNKFCSTAVNDEMVSVECGRQKEKAIFGCVTTDAEDERSGDDIKFRMMAEKD